MEREFADVKINNKYYRIDITTYNIKDVTDFSPRASVPGSGIIYGELGLYQPVMFTDWKHGFGFQWHEDPEGYLYTEGNVDTRHSGIAMLFTQSTQSDSDYTTDSRSQFLNFAGDLYSEYNGGIRKYVASDDLWSDAFPTTSDGVKYLWQNGKYLFALTNNEIFYASSPSTDASSDGWQTTGINASSVDYNWLHHHDGYVYAGKDEDVNGLNGHYVYFDDNVDLSQLAGTASDDPAAIPVGIDGYKTFGAFSFSGDIHVPRADGLYRIDKDRTAARKVLDFNDVASSDNFRSWTIHNGYVVFPIRDVLYQWTGARLTDITPPPITDTYPYETYGQFDNFVVHGKFLFMSARTSSTSYEEHIICFDGVGWHKLVTVAESGTGGITSMYFDAINNRLWYALEDGKVYYIQFNERSRYPYASFPTTGTHTIVTSRIAAGFRRINKSTPSLLVEVDNCSSNRYIQVYYKLDDGSWIAWGGEDGTTNKIDTTGITELRNPTGTNLSTIEYNYIQLKFKFITTDSSQSPVLSSATLRVLLRPNEYYAYGFLVEASAQNQPDDRSTFQIWSDLQEARESKAPIDFIDVWGVPHKVYITALSENARSRSGADYRGGKEQIESLIRVNMVEVLNE